MIEVLENLRLAEGLLPDTRIVIEDGVTVSIGRDAPAKADRRIDLDGALVTPPLIDLQINGGDGLMLGDLTSAMDVARIVAAQRRLGVTECLPTLISDTPERTEQVVRLVEAARAQGCPGLLGLHLEGPHLTRAGAHDQATLRAMTDADLDFYCALPARVGHVMLTLAPERVALGRIAALTAAGVIVSLGHTDCSAAEAAQATAEGARCATHLFNAMSGLSHRAPGLAAHALLHMDFGLIADRVHVAPEMIQLALRAGGTRAFLVSDGMALMGSTKDHFSLQGRRISRAGDRLTLGDGTLAGAALPLWEGVRNVAEIMGWPLDQAAGLAWATPRRILGLSPWQNGPGRPLALLAWPRDGAPRLRLGQDWVGPTPTSLSRP